MLSTLKILKESRRKPLTKLRLLSANQLCCLGQPVLPPSVRFSALASQAVSSTRSRTRHRARQLRCSSALLVLNYLTLKKLLIICISVINRINICMCEPHKAHKGCTVVLRLISNCSFDIRWPRQLTWVYFISFPGFWIAACYILSAPSSPPVSSPQPPTQFHV